VDGFECPVCVPGNTCAFGPTDVFNSAGEADTLPAHCLIGNLEECTIQCSADNCLNGALKTDLSPLAQATCDGFECPVCAPGNTCAFGDTAFNTVDGQSADTPVNCLIANLDVCPFECSPDNCLYGALKTDLTPLAQATCVDYECPVCDPGNTCAFENGVFNTVDGQSADTPVNCLVADLDACYFEYSSDNFNGALKTELSAPVQAACATFDCPVVDCLGFECYFEAIINNQGHGGSKFLWKGMAIQDQPWTYTGDFQLGMSGNQPWGRTQSIDGDVYAIFQRESSIQQTLSGLVTGQDYTITWFQQGRTNRKANLDIYFSYGGLTIYQETNIVNKSWESKSAEFTASDGGILKIWTENPFEGDRTMFIDKIVLTKKI
jgi:hypothetical protein